MASRLADKDVKHWKAPFALAPFVDTARKWKLLVHPSIVKLSECLFAESYAPKTGRIKGDKALRHAARVAALALDIRPPRLVPSTETFNLSKEGARPIHVVWWLHRAYSSGMYLLQQDMERVASFIDCSYDILSIVLQAVLPELSAAPEKATSVNIIDTIAAYWSNDTKEAIDKRNATNDMCAHAKNAIRDRAEEYAKQLQSTAFVIQFYYAPFERSPERAGSVVDDPAKIPVAADFAKSDSVDMLGNVAMPLCDTVQMIQDELGIKRDEKIDDRQGEVSSWAPQLGTPDGQVPYETVLLCHLMHQMFRLLPRYRAFIKDVVERSRRVCHDLNLALLNHIARTQHMYAPELICVKFKLPDALQTETWRVLQFIELARIQHEELCKLAEMLYNCADICLATNNAIANKEMPSFRVNWALMVQNSQSALRVEPVHVQRRVSEALDRVCGKRSSAPAAASAAASTAAAATL